MFFGISYGELLVIAGAGAVVFGRKDLIAFASTAGRLTGRAAGILAAARNRFAAFTESAELAELHRDMKGTMSQLDSIREELRRGVVPRSSYSRLASVIPPLDIPPQAMQQQHLFSGANLQQEMLPAAAGVATKHEGADQPAQTASSTVSRVSPLPALSGADFAAMGTASATSSFLVNDPAFDSAAYAAYQSLFDVPAGRYTPELERHASAAAPTAAVANPPSHNSRVTAMPCLPYIAPAPTEEAAATAAPDAAFRGIPGSGIVQQLSTEGAVQPDQARLFAQFLETAEAQQLLREALHSAASSNSKPALN